MLERFPKHKKDQELSIAIHESIKIDDPSYRGFVITTPDGRTVPLHEDESPEHVEQDYENDILKDREKSYGNPIQMHNRIAQIWSALLNKPVTAYEVALCMTGLKLARATKNASDPDSLIDAHGYTEIAQTIQADIDNEYPNA